MIASIDTRRISDWDSFHEVFAEAFGFPAYYGRNLDAWIDCMTNLNDSQAGEVVLLQLEHVDEFAKRCPEQYEALFDCSAFVNHRQLAADRGPVLALAFQRQPKSQDPPPRIE